MDESRQRGRSDRSKERRKKRRESGEPDGVEDPRVYHTRKLRQAYGEPTEEPSGLHNYPQESTYPEEFEHQNPPEQQFDAGNYGHNRRQKKKSKKPSSRHQPYPDENEYVNAPYVPGSDYSRHPDSIVYEEQEYDDDENGGFDENYPEPEESMLSGSNRFRGTADDYSQPHRRSSRVSSYTPQNEGAPSHDVMSDSGRHSVTDGTPRALGGNEHEFWNPDLEPDGGVQQPHQLTPAPANGLQKFLASFRRPKKSKVTTGALTEHNSSNADQYSLARVIMLDGEEVSYQLDRNDTGQSLLSRVCQMVDIVETDYFGLTYVSNKLRTWFWLEPEKKISKQLRNGEQWLFSFQVKFYPPEPTLLQEDITRYQLTLQVRQDIYTGKLPCSWVTQALLGSFMVQAELGDYDEREHGGSTDYLKEFEFVPSPTPQLIQKIAELHKTHVGMKPNQADIKYLETAKRLELYGVDLHPVRDTENVEIYMGVGFHGIVIYRDRLRIGRFAWPKVLRISYKKNNFYLKIRPDNSEPVETVIGFRLLNHHLANRLWKAAVEHHAFFRLKEARSPKGPSTPLTSSYNYTGHTFFQYRTMNINRPHPQFDRSLTKRRTASMPMGLNKTGSMHTLNRAHPRDMTVGRTQDSDSLISKRAGSVQQSLSGRHAGSVGQLYSTVPRAAQLGLSDGRSQMSQQASELGEHSLSYGGSARDSYTAGSQSHDYLNQRQPIPLNRPAADRSSSMSGQSGSQSEVLRRGQPGAPSHRRPSSPRYTNVRQRGSVDQATPSELSQATVSSRQTGDRTPSGRKPPLGGVPALGGIMLTDAAMTRHSKTSALRASPVPKSRHHKEVPQYYDEDEDNSDPPLEYDDDEDDENANDIDYPQTAAHGHRGSQARASSRNTPASSLESGRNKYRQNKSSSSHTTRRNPDSTELML
ncbi:hypothetical protein EG68_05200 [Paragonimus skrjabini miyazakii]|uniref:FERM domain-containing protein n=1 Tax=Paragonimus skrjabini miyazakii TaxID=59628 RepID=A0A8S9YVI6_9TREM|nr:hypothetical protein EG68_05200 [Paragonimus skrjabini miyazakii]